MVQWYWVCQSLTRPRVQSPGVLLLLCTSKRGSSITNYYYWARAQKSTLWHITGTIQTYSSRPTRWYPWIFSNIKTHRVIQGFHLMIRFNGFHNNDYRLLLKTNCMNSVHIVSSVCARPIPVIIFEVKYWWIMNITYATIFHLLYWYNLEWDEAGE